MMQVVMHMAGKEKATKGGRRPGAREKDLAALTVRLPREEYEELRGLAEARGVSLNCLAAEALERYTVGQKRLELLKEIDAFRAKLRPLAEGEEDSVTALRRLRLERVKHLCGEDDGNEDEP